MAVATKMQLLKSACLLLAIEEGVMELTDPDKVWPWLDHDLKRSSRCRYDSLSARFGA